LVRRKQTKGNVAGEPRERREKGAKGEGRRRASRGKKRDGAGARGVASKKKIWTGQ